MVQEVRKIMLTKDELISAFECYRRMTPDFLPEGRVVNCTPIDEATIQATVEVPHAGEWQLRDFLIRGLDVLKPLIRFCIENNIMLPKSGRKSIAILNGSVVICIALNLEIDVSQYVSPMRIHHMSELTPADIEMPEKKLANAINRKA